MVTRRTLGRGKTTLNVTDQTDVKQVHAALTALAKREVLVGFPEDTTERDDDGDKDLTNAELAYIHDNGAPEANIPARPFMIPGIAAAEGRLAETMLAGGRRVLQSKHPHLEVEPALHTVGLVAQAAIRSKINEGVPPPLAEATLHDRARRGRKGAKMELERRSRGEAPSTEFAKPLIDTGQMRNAVNYAIRDRKRRRR